MPYDFSSPLCSLLISLFFIVHFSHSYKSDNVSEMVFCFLTEHHAMKAYWGGVEV